jgi:hypothetical protein
MSFKSICDLRIFCPVNINRTMDTQLEILHALVSDSFDIPTGLSSGLVFAQRIIPAALALAHQVEQMQGLPGPEKLQLVMTTLRYGVQKTTQLSAEDKQKLLGQIDFTIPLVIQAAILASKSPIMKKVTGCCWK